MKQMDRPADDVRSYGYHRTPSWHGWPPRRARRTPIYLTRVLGYESAVYFCCLGALQNAAKARWARRSRVPSLARDREAPAIRGQ